MSGYRVAHRYEETSSGVLRQTESGIFDTEATDNPGWVQEFWDQADEANASGSKLGIKNREAGVLRSEYTDRIDARPFGGEPDQPVEDAELSIEVAGSQAQAEDVEAEADADADAEADAEVEVPPKGGAGSGVQVWARYAQSKNVELTEGMTRDDIVAACEAAGVPTE